MAELWDIYDKNRKKTGKIIERGSELAEDEYHLVVQVWIRNSANEWLISKRTANKSMPLKWEPTGGSVLAGETSMEAALREVREELGINLEQQNGLLFHSYRREKESWENPGFLDVWIFEKDFSINDVVLQEYETCDAKWATSDEIEQMMEQGDFVPMKEHPYYVELFQFQENKKQAIEYVENELAYETYASLRTSVDWINFSEDQTRRALERSFYTLTALKDSQAVAMARLVGDGLYLTAVDVVVNPDFQGIGIGKTMMKKLIQHVKDITPVGGRVSLQLIAEKGKEGFYTKLGFKLIPHEYCGSGMRMVIRS